MCWTEEAKFIISVKIVSIEVYIRSSSSFLGFIRAYNFPKLVWFFYSRDLRAYMWWNSPDIALWYHEFKIKPWITYNMAFMLPSPATIIAHSDNTWSVAEGVLNWNTYKKKILNVECNIRKIAVITCNLMICFQLCQPISLWIHVQKLQRKFL